MINILSTVSAFAIFCLLQSLLINGVYEAARGKCINDMIKGEICDGNIFYKMAPSWFERNKGKVWMLPLFGCVKCMASAHSIYTYWPVALWSFGFHWWEVYLWFMDILILVSLNAYIYKKL